jgi:hypothetical protein
MSAIHPNGTSARAGFRVLQDDALAGGPLSIEFVVENTGTQPAYFFTATDRSRLRPDNFTLQAGVQGSDVVLTDPLANVPYLGGPGGVLEVEPGAQIKQRLLVNNFVTLEQTRDVLAPGEASTVWIRGLRTLALTATEDQALQGGGETAQIDATLSIPIRRDDAALEALVASLADSIRADQSTNVSAQREQTIGELVALRLPMVVPQLESLKDHPDPAVKMYVQRALATH